MAKDSRGLGSSKSVAPDLSSATQKGNPPGVRTHSTADASRGDRARTVQGAVSADR